MNVQFYTIGPSPHLVEVLDALHRRPSVELEVVYECEHLPGRDWEPAFGEAPCVCLDSRDLFGRGQLWDSEILRVAETGAPDVAVVSTSYASLNTYAIIWRLCRDDIPFVFWAERLSPLSPWWVDRARHLPVQWILSRASGFVGSTQATVNFYDEAFQFEGPMCSVPYHRDLTAFLDLPVLEAPPREGLRFLIVSSLTEGKAVDVVLRALQNVSPSVDLQILGDGPQRERLEREAEHCGLHEVEFLGTVPYEQVPAVVGQAHVVLFPSRHDGFGMVTMEALAAGVPVVASDQVMSALEYIESGYNGWITSVDDVDAWRNAIQYIVDRRDQLPEWSAAARDTVVTMYDVDEDVEALVSFLHAVAED
jgi:glycosyltransferase involved in cell wall biosynthesis